MRKSIILKAAVAIGALAYATAAGAQQTTPPAPPSQDAQDPYAAIVEFD